ncbi:GNAT family N-acetyltransferase [Mesorhizobium sp. CU2]|uniref:GNAT family N-acetyltransferase n=1 Tax=unclassified Mesorhizobium TaxID=325217 RepID=UPI00112D0C54|nr:MULTISPECIES: GNAT family N-acetyltransferase [unclassified Mesorhizobium]TPN83668.1 GNAT family N-acetyltransferase [Mesorhizobium sp. CU3]TPO01610.1 GNAT family N-acetyltransferase [Mesorhizobium sp. CU2]
MSNFPEAVLRPAIASDAIAIARTMRASLNAFPWMPLLHTPEEDLFFIQDILLPNQQVTVAVAGERIVGFIAVNGEWVDQLYLDPAWTGQGIGSRLLARATAGMPSIKLRCFQANTDARRFYERHGFRAEGFGDGSANEEGLPDILYVLRR